MQHRWDSGVGSGRVGFVALLTGAVALLGCYSASGPELGRRTTTDQHGPALPAGGDRTEAGAEGSSSDASGAEVSGSDVSLGTEPPLTVDDIAANTCVASAEFVPLGVVPDDYTVIWNVLGSRASHVFWAHEYSGGDTRIEPFRWTPLGGVENLNDVLQLPAVEGQSVNGVSAVSTDGSAILSFRLLEDRSLAGMEAFLYTPQTGAVALDFTPRTLSRDGKVAFGYRDGRLVRWTESGGTVELALPIEMAEWSFESAQLSSEWGETVLGVGVLAGPEPHVVRWGEATGWVDLGLLPVGAAGPETMAALLSDVGDVIVGTLGNPANGGSRVFRWTETSGSTQLGALAGLPPQASYMATHLSSDGSVVVGSVQIPGQPASHVFRWTEALGMQDLMPGVGNVYPSQMSARGDVVIGGASDRIVPTNSHRWTEAGGFENLDLSVWAASADANLLVGERNGKPAILAVRTPASSWPTLAQLAPTTIVPADWSRALIDSVSADGQLIVGVAQNPLGQREAWLLRRTESCPPPQ